MQGLLQQCKKGQNMPLKELRRIGQRERRTLGIPGQQELRKIDQTRPAQLGIPVLSLGSQRWPRLEKRGN